MTAWAAPALAGAAYYLLALAGAVRWRRGALTGAGELRLPAISILKPVHGRDPRFYEAIASHARQDYPEFEILFGISGPSEEARAAIERLRAEFPRVPISVRDVSTSAPNQKAGVLAVLARDARYPILLVNDSDILVEPGYLRAVAAPLMQPGIGLVTCLYRAEAESWPARLEALGIATEFAPSVLAARALGIAGFALGSTMVFCKKTLDEIGGFESIAPYLADDYQLGLKIAQLGYQIEMAPVVVSTNLGAGSWTEVWRHQLRWARTIRVSRRSGYYGYMVTHATVWALVAFAAGESAAGTLALAIRLAAGVAIGRGILKDRRLPGDACLIPFRDLFGFAVWVAGAFGRHVEWRDRRLELRSDGRICEEPQAIPKRST